MEEIGVDVDTLRSVQLSITDPALDAHAFVVTGWTGEPANLAPDEHDDLAWFGPEHVDTLDLAHPALLQLISTWLARG